MKKTILLSIVAGCLVLPAVTRADAPKAKDAKTRQSASTTVVAPPKRLRIVYYISDRPATGSNIPMVRRSYDGYVDNAASPAVYGSTQIRETGALDVGTALYKLDPSFTAGIRR